MATTRRGRPTTRRTGTGPGGPRKGAGRKSRFPKKLRQPLSVVLTQTGQRLLEEATRRLGATRSDVVEALVRQYAEAIELPPMPPTLEEVARLERERQDLEDRLRDLEARKRD